MLRRVSMMALSGAALLAAGATGGALAATPVVSVFPSPGAHVASARTQISFRGVAAGAVGPLQVTGSRSGRHAGTLLAHSDGRGASFVPSVRFTPGEVVTVRTRLSVRGARDGDFQLQIATPGPALKAGAVPRPVLGGSGIQRFHSRHDLIPAKLTTSAIHGRLAPGDVLLGKLSLPGLPGPGQNGPMILDPRGQLIWFHPLKAPELALDVRVQRYRGQQVLTWWQGFVGRGVGAGVGVVLDRSYRQIATVRAGNGLFADPHELLLTDRGTAFVLAETPVVWDLSSIHGARRAVVYDSAIQQIDVATGLVLFEWHSLDHVDVSESYVPPVKVDGHIFDYFHVNSVNVNGDGSLLVSARNTWAVYKLDSSTGAVDWRLNGKRSSFAMAKGSTFAWQHDAHAQPDGTLTLFDDGAAPPVHTQSHGIAIAIDTHRMRAWLAKDYRHAPKVLSGSQGNLQILPGGDALIGWGSSPLVSEQDSHGKPLVDYRFPAGAESYRAYRSPWDPLPATVPALAASRDGGSVTLYMSWNGAASVATWQVLAGPRASALAPLSSVRRGDFETTATVRTAQPLLAVQAKDAAGRVLATSAAVTPGA